VLGLTNVATHAATKPLRKARALTPPTIDASAAPASPTLQNVLPILKRSEDSIWAQVEAYRDELFAALQQACRDEGYEALLIKSGPFIQPAWVKIECWIPSADGKTSGRASALIKIHAKEFHRRTMEFSVEVHDRGWSKTYDRLVGLAPKHADQLARFVLGRGRAPLLARLQVRRYPWQLWRPVNKLNVLGMDWMQVGPWILFLLALLLVAPVPPLGLLLFVAGVAAIIMLKRRRASVLSSGKPRAEPRHLHRVDSWQVVISGLGGEATSLRARLLDALATPPMDGLESRVEKIWDWGLDGIVERDQIVMTLRRGWVFCQIYGYRDELYVGWDAHLNSAQWVETTVATGIDKQTRSLIRVNSVQSGEQPLTDYDIVDLNCLAEWTHARLVQLVQRLMSERDIDQQIDFQIIRGERPKTGETEKPTDQIRRGVGQLGRRLVRTS
jgi:hypothetical protein